MSERKIDRRVKYTKSVLKDAIISLLETKPISKITIKELCEVADINRGTFYAHYSDQYDLLSQIGVELMSDVDSYLTSIEKYDKNTHSDELDSRIFSVISACFEYIHENRKTIKILISDNCGYDIQKEAANWIRNRKMEDLEKVDYMDENAKNFTYSYVASGTIGIIREWLNTDNNISSSEIAEYVYRMIRDGINGFRVKAANK
ncbi:MAG: TetR/AcrR family transcriptional regulator [Clostridiales bacterium]|nr:TetR/AcrR family transcriptional regulator [Clostridiales bacterium]